jgi:uncharacterized membrane protein
MQGYEQMMPGAANRFLTLVEGEAEHRRSMERWLVKGGVVLSFTGMICALVVGIFGLYVAWSLGTQGHTAAAGIIAALDITSLVGLFLWRQKKEALPQDELPEA